MRLFLSMAIFAALAAGCSSSSEADLNEEDDVGESHDLLTNVEESERTAARAVDISRFQLELPTATGTELFKAARYWIDHQLEDSRYPKPKRCAANVSKVSFLGGVTRYDSEAVWGLLDEVRKAEGAEVYRLAGPKRNANGSLDKAPFIDALNQVHGGRIPVGTFVAGCGFRGCGGEPGAQHIGMIGHTDPDGTVWAYHNNWYRPDNEGSTTAWKPHMIFTHFGQAKAAQLYNNGRGLVRNWMPTPWLKLKRDASGKIIDVESLMPAIDDMDPFNGKYQITLAIMPEIARELRR